MFNPSVVAPITIEAELLTTQEAAVALRCCPRSVAYLLARKVIKKTTFGRKVFIHRSEVSRLIRNGVPSIRTASKGVR